MLGVDRCCYNNRVKKNSRPQELLIPASIGIVGYGIVGYALAYGFERKSERRDQICYFDKYKESKSLEEVVEKSEFIFITLPTPMKQDEVGIDLSIIEENIAQISSLTNRTDKIIIIKSTVVPGTTRYYEQKYPQTNFCFNPEFLTEANYLQDFLSANRHVIGATNDLVSRRVASLYELRWPKARIYQTDPTTAEAVKYFANAYLATKVTLANVIYDYCQALGIAYNEVKELAVADPRIGKSHLEVTTLRGFGQKCLPKDMVALLGEFKRMGLDASVLSSIWEYNKKVRKVHDWEEIPFAVAGNYQEDKDERSSRKVSFNKRSFDG